MSGRRLDIGNTWKVNQSEILNKYLTQYGKYGKDGLTLHLSYPIQSFQGHTEFVNPVDVIL